MNKDRVEGRARSVDGTTEELIGKVIDSKRMKRKGKTRRAVGKAQARCGDIKDDLAGRK